MVKQQKGMPRATKPNRRIMVNQRTGLKFSNFFDTKNGLVEPTCEQLHQWKQNSITVNYIRLNNAGENKLLKQRCHSEDWKFNTLLEFTARATPQQNALAELGFATLANRGGAMISAANVPETIRYKVYSEAFKNCNTVRWSSAHGDQWHHQDKIRTLDKQRKSHICNAFTYLGRGGNCYFIIENDAKSQGPRRTVYVCWIRVGSSG
jgi:hypothetical protein